jgi:hypothetical protein
VLSYSHLPHVLAMRSKVSKRPLSTTPAGARESEEGARLRKKVRWDPKSDDEEMGTATASDDFEGTGEEQSTTSDNEKVRLFLPLRRVGWTSRSRNPVHRSALLLVVKGKSPIHTFELVHELKRNQRFSGRRIFRPY